MTEETSGHEHVEIDKQFLDMLAAKFTAKQLGQGKLAPTKAATALATMLASFYKELHRDGIPRALSFKLTIALLHIILQH